MARKNVSYDNRFRFKLNMLLPGTVMMTVISLLVAAGMVLCIAGLIDAAYVTFTVAGIIFAVLVLLLAVEAYQDKVLNDMAIRENKKKGEL